jgi:hypothetical protein
MAHFSILYSVTCRWGVAKYRTCRSLGKDSSTAHCSVTFRPSYRPQNLATILVRQRSFAKRVRLDRSVCTSQSDAYLLVKLLFFARLASSWAKPDETRRSAQPLVIRSLFPAVNLGTPPADELLLNLQRCVPKKDTAAPWQDLFEPAGDATNGT